LVKITSGFKPHLATSAPTEIQTKTISIPKPTVKNTAAAAKITTPDADVPEFEVKKPKLKSLVLVAVGGILFPKLPNELKNPLLRLPTLILLLYQARRKTLPFSNLEKI